jgi:hypothetical protein
METPKLSALVLGIAFVALVLDAGGGPGWSAATTHTILAARGEHLAASPLYGAIASAFTTLLPAGEPGFRLGVLAALLGAFMLAGVVAAARALLPKDPVAAIIAAIVVALAPAFRDAAAFAAPAMLAAAGLAWSVAFALRRNAPAAVLASLFVIGSAPWLGAALAITLVIWLARDGARRDQLALVVGALGLAIVVLWFDAAGSLPGASHAPFGAALLAAGRGAGAITLGAGIAGLAFGALTNLPRTRPLAIVLVVAIAHELVVGGNGPAVLAACAIGVAILPGAIVRAAGSSLVGVRRHAITAAAGIPLVAVALLTGPTLAVDDPADEPRMLADDLIDAVPPGTGVFVATRPASFLALQHEAVIAGARPYLALTPPMDPMQADAVVAAVLRSGHIAASDAASFGRLDIARTLPRGRGFQLLVAAAPAPASVLGPAHYATDIGREQAILLAVERARLEGANGRLDAAARALGLESRFGAADLAVLGASLPTPERPALFGLIPAELMSAPTGQWLIDLFGDDLAWVGGLALPQLPYDAPPARQLHERWRAILSGQATPDDPAIAALGPAAVRATKALFVEHAAPPPPPPRGR